jgi:Putative metallopeptidase
MTDWISHRGSLIGAIAAAALIVTMPAASAQPAATAQPATPAAKLAAAIDEAVKGLDSVPRLKKLSPEKKKQLVEFVIGNTLFVLTHEMGHGLINEMQMPVLGREEDAADSFAIVTALKMGTAISERVLIEAAKGQVFSSKRDKKEGNPLAFYDEHGLDLQRAYNIVCFMVGSNPEKYTQLAKDTKLPEYRQKGCKYEWENTEWSWDEMLKKHLRGDKPKLDVKVTYEENKKFAVQEHILREIGLLEAIVAHATDRYAWPNPWSVEAKSCGDANASWRSRKLTLCYELAGYFTELFLGFEKTVPKKYR